MKINFRISIVVTTLVLVSLTAVADDYEPDIVEFNEQTGLSFAGHPAFNMGEGGTVEFWVAPGWQTDPGYDPVLLSSETDDDFSLVLSMLGDKTGLTIQTRDNYGEVSFDFSDGTMHHVAVVSLDGTTLVMVDGQPLDELTLGLPNEVPTTLWMGSINGEDLPFVGAMGGFRIWDAAIELEELVVFALLDPLDPEFPHPDLSALSAFSDLTNDTIEISDFLWAEESEELSVTALVEASE